MIQSTQNGSWDVAAQCFLNSLIRETKDWRLSQGEPAELVIPLTEEKALHFKVAYFSPTQHHRFCLPGPAGHSPWQRDGDVRHRCQTDCR